MKYLIAEPLKRLAWVAGTKVYLDMDGVICDFEKAVKDLGPGLAAGLSKDANPEDKETMWKTIDKAGADFWANMEWTEDGKKIWELVKDLNPVLLSSPGKIRFAPAGKENWVKKNIPGTPLFLETDKYQYAQGVENEGAILIDDTQENISTWEKAGGKGILHETVEKTEAELKKLILP